MAQTIENSCMVERAEEALRVKTEQLAAVSEAMAAFIASGDWRESSALILQNALRQTESEYGFVGVVVQGPVLRILAHEGTVWDENVNREFYEHAVRTYKEIGYLEFRNFDNLFGKVITTGRVVISNDPATDIRSGGIPPGHPLLRHFLGVPILKGREVVGMIGIANRAGGYTGSEQGKIEILSQAASVIYDSYRRQEQEAALEKERKRAEENLRESETRFRQLAENIHEVFWVEDPLKQDILYVSPAYEEIWGQTCASLYERPLSFLDPVHLDDRERVVASVARQKRGENTDTEYRLVRRDGSIRWIRDRGFPIKDSTGRVYRVVGIAEDISGRKRSEEALKASEERYRLLVTSAPVCIHEIDRAGRLISINPAGLKMMGADDESQICGIAYLDAVSLADRPRVAEFLARALKGESSEFEFVAAGEGESRVFASCFIPIKGEKGVVRRLMGITRDITDRRRAENRLKQALAWQKAIFEGSRDAIFITDIDSRFIAVNDAACELAGYSKEELLRMRISDLHEEADLSAYKKYHDQIMAGEEILSEAKILRKDGRKVDAEFSNRRVCIGGLLYMHTTARDITERKRSEEALKSSEERYRRFFEKDLAGAYISTPDGRLLDCNPAFARIFGFDSVEDALNHNLASFYRNPVDRKTFFDLMKKQGRLEYYEEELRRKDGELVQVIENAIGTFNERGELIEVLGFLIDDTERRKVEEQFRQAQKMDAIGRLAGGVAHDFNNLLTAMLGYSKLALSSLHDGDPLREYIEEIEKAGKRAAALTNQLLAFSRKQVLQPKVLDLNGVIVEVEKLLRRLIGENIELITNLEPELGRVKADPGQIEQVIMNLAVNSRDAMPQGGKLVIETSNAYLDEDFTRKHTSAHLGMYVMLAVSDNGSGMDEETCMRVFEPFFTTKEKGKGTGLGLSTVYGIVKQSGGHITVESQPGLGTVFRIYLQMIDEESESMPAPAQETESAKGSETILVVEDEQGVRKLARQILEMSGYRVLEARHGAEALMICQQQESPIDLILTDVVMPEMGGRALVDHLASVRPEIRALYMSGHTDNVGPFASDAAFIQKPFTPETLRSKVREALDS
ncbi:MAG: PAS domain S-box protein [Acidobacteriota bacterium]